jgi:hypothetical protein
LCFGFKFDVSWVVEIAGYLESRLRISVTFKSDSEQPRLGGVCHVLKFMLNRGDEIKESTKKSANKQRAFALWSLT